MGAVTETLSYNIQGWLTEQSSPQFSMKLRYYDTSKGTNKYYTGNIAEWEWNHTPSTPSAANTYTFTYDRLSRLRGSRHFVDYVAENLFFEQGITYDKHGNIKTLQRYDDGATANDFTYNYTGNQLTRLVDAETESTHAYEYDPNGNMTSDGQKNLKFGYNYLNLTNEVKDLSDNVQAVYTYTADGVKLSVKNASGTSGYEYLGSLVYQYVNGNLQLESAPFAAGRIIAGTGSSGAVYTPNYFLTDHLGSTRAIYNGSGHVARSDFYPFGRHWNSGEAPASRYQFTGYEDQELLDRKYMDAGARFYDALRFATIDPLAEKYYSISPYAYCANNPVNAIDPNGEKIIFVNGYLGFGTPQGGSAYWGGKNSSFVSGAQKFFNDDATPHFTNYEHSKLKSLSSLIVCNDGYKYAKENYEELTKGMDPQKDVFHIVSHSMGSPLSEGIIKYLKEQGWTVVTAVHFNAWLPQFMKTSDGTMTIDATITNDPVQALSLPQTGDSGIPGADYTIRKTSTKKWGYRHRDLIDSGDIWNTNSKTTWNQAMSIIQSWLQQNPNIKISYE